MHQVEPTLAGRKEPDPGSRFAENPPVDAVGAPERLGGAHPVINDPGLLVPRRVKQPDVQPALRHVEVRNPDRQPVRATVDDGGRFDGLLHAFEAHPVSRKPGQGESQDSEVEDFLHARGGENRNARIHEREFGLVQGCRTLTGVVVAERHEDAAEPGGARHVGVPQRVPRTVHARPLSVPQAEDTVMEALTPQFGLLRPPQGGCRQILVDRRRKTNICRLQQRSGLSHLHIERAERGPAVSGDVTGCVQSRRRVARCLLEHQPDKGLCPVEQNIWAGEIKSV